MKLGLIVVVGLAAMLHGQEIRLTPVASGISAPTDIQHAGDGTGRLFLVQQNGIIRILRGGAVVSRPFLDITGKTRGGGERGLLGLAFPPGFAQKRRFYVNYTDLNGDTIIARYRVCRRSRRWPTRPAKSSCSRSRSPSPTTTAASSLSAPTATSTSAWATAAPAATRQRQRPEPRHPARQDAPHRRRLATPGRATRIPADNPFARPSRHPARDLGLRSPQPLALLASTAQPATSWIADVGQDAWEEVNFQPAASRGGENYGWNLMEGAHCSPPSNCNTRGLTLPVPSTATPGAARSPAGSSTAGAPLPACGAPTSTATTAAAASGASSGRAQRG